MTHFITGISSGLGLSLTDQILEAGGHVYGVSRRGYPEKRRDCLLTESKLDLFDLDSIPDNRATLLNGVRKLDVVILNAGILGGISNMVDASVSQLERTMTINVWSNKVILDWLLKNSVTIDQIVMVSSGAAVNSGKGWGGYSLSKAALNMLAQLYSHEFRSTHLTSLAPGIVDTAMQEFIGNPDNIDVSEFPSFKRLRDARAEGSMPTGADAAKRILSVLPTLTQFPSGSFVDIRDLP